ncbi:regulatory protein TetR [Spirochaeta thermophila DSM 6578]|uniref:Regulatory protein TetR n=1 Tax=Winmispira thermophila (strain ATCC 700085 / DSM 6578 / Z-1203) TaxID=869211 RepID=G0GFZ0_WINT7|nr:TetR/AcrR family transcriptional regulator [Spirochaeta thermophila]AEJ62466.1 regulatory protein TetR [Spirochaeta thermophila DSM 6578]
MTSDDIIRAALRGWAKDRFQRLTLTRVAEELGVTKQALYRYFPSKESLFEAILVHARDVHGTLVRDLTRISSLSFEEGLFFYLSRLLEDFKAHTGLYLFLYPPQHITIQERFKDFYREVEENSIEVMGTLLSRPGAPHIPDPYVPHIQKLIGTTFLFSLLKEFPKKRENPWESFSTFFSSMDSEKRVKTIMEVIIHGTVRGSFVLPDFDRVRAIARVEEAEAPHFDRILSAAEKVIHEKGIANTTLDDIAHEVGITRTTLYSYFKNKRDLVVSTILRQITGFFDPLFPRLAVCTSIEEKILCYILYAAEYSHIHKRLFSVTNWLRINSPLRPLRDARAWEQIRPYLERFALLFSPLPLRKALKPAEMIPFLHILTGSLMQEKVLIRPSEALIVWAYFLEGLKGIERHAEQISAHEKDTDHERRLP